MRAFFIAPVLTMALATTALAAPDDLPPPNVTPYLEAMVSSTDLDPFVDQRDTGIKLRFGFRFNDTESGLLTWSAEGGLSLLGDDSETLRETRPEPDPVSPYEETRLVIDRSARINGFEFGARAEVARFFYLRGGVFLYSLNEKEKINVTQIDQDNIEPDRSFDRSPSSDSSNGTAPYMGLGAQWQLDDSLSLLADFSATRIEGEQLESAALGIRLNF